MSIDIETAARVARLARIRVDEAALPALAQEFNTILGFIEQLNEVDVEGVEPMTSVTPQRLKRRDDVVTAGDQQAGCCRTRPTRARVLCRAEGGRMTGDLNAMTIAEARDALRRGEVTSVDLTEACLSAADAAGALNAFVHPTPDLARDQARAADARIAAGDAPAMCGIPLGIKDLFCTEGVPSQAASRILDGFPPGIRIDRDAQPLRRGRGDAGQAQHGRVRDGIVERDLLLWQRRQPVAARQ